MGSTTPMDDATTTLATIFEPLRNTVVSFLQAVFLTYWPYEVAGMIIVALVGFFWFVIYRVTHPGGKK